jgi:hypothetical protein
MVLDMTLRTCWDGSTVPPGLDLFCVRFPALPRWALIWGVPRDLDFGLALVLTSGLGFGVSIWDLALGRARSCRLWSRLGVPAGSMHRQQFFQHATQLGRLQRIRCVRFRLFRVVMHFEKYAVHTRADRRACQ